MTHATKSIYRWLLSDYIKVRYNTTQKDYFRALLQGEGLAWCVCMRVSV